MRTSLECAKLIAKAVSQRGGCAYYVGGYVRDRLLNIENKDVDIEVHGIAAEELEGILESVGTCIKIGKSFGVYNVKGCSLDIAMPRQERTTGMGHRDFEIRVDPFIGTKKAAARRDFTINALMMNVLTGEVVDYFNGTQDLKMGILRHVSDDAFGEDPLRVFRCAQFAARFQFRVADETVKLCRHIDVKPLSSERVFEELKKALLKAEKPSLFFETLKDMNQLGDWFSEVEQLIGVEQNRKHHAEGDVWTHSMMVLDEAAKRREKVNHPLGFMLSALVHDFGKVISTEFKNGEFHAYQHETKGLPMIDAFLRRLTKETALIRYVLNMAELHMKPTVMAGASSSVKATNKLFDGAKEPNDLIHLAICDSLGKIPRVDCETTEGFLRERLEVFEETMRRPYVTGQDLIANGLTAGNDFSELLRYAHKLRLAGIPKESALKQTLAQAKNK